MSTLLEVDSANGDGSFRVNFFLDTAYWTPWWDRGHFDDQVTVGTFSKFEPQWEFPEVNVQDGDLRWGVRTAEFSKDTKSRKHEIQLGQTYSVTLAPKKKKKKKKSAQVSADAEGRRTVTVAEEGSHWPRMWRVLLDHDELEEMAKLDKKARRGKLDFET